MLKITPEALELIRKRREGVFLELPKVVSGCCYRIQECPMVRFGEPRDRSTYEETRIGDQPVWVPRDFPGEDMALTIVVSQFLWVKRLALEGWRLA
jgi:hypothetical protein